MCPDPHSPRRCLRAVGHSGDCTYRSFADDDIARVDSLAAKGVLAHDDFVGDLLDTLDGVRSDERERCARELEDYARGHPATSEDYQFVLMAARLLRAKAA